MESRSARSRLLAFIDESGQRSSSAASSDHFTMAAVAWHEDWDSDAGTLLRHIRSALGRQPSQEIHFVRLSHHDRLLAARRVGQACANLTIVTVTVCKRELPSAKWHGPTCRKEDPSTLRDPMTGSNLPTSRPVRRFRHLNPDTGSWNAATSSNWNRRSIAGGGI